LGRHVREEVGVGLHGVGAVHIIAGHDVSAVIAGALAGVISAVGRLLIRQSRVGAKRVPTLRWDDVLRPEAIACPSPNAVPK
jgi:hypothetical protein